MDAITLLRRLNADSARRVPDDAPVGFVPAKWRRYVTGSDGRIDRHGWEVSALTELRGALRAADIWVEHSRRYRDPTSYLIPIDHWERLRPESPAATGIPLDPDERLHQLDGVVNDHLSALDAALTDTDSVRIEHDRLVVTPLLAETPDPELEQLRNSIRHLLPQVDLVDLLVEVNTWCGFLDSLVHAGHSTDRSPDHAARLLAAVVANGCNFGLATMARIAGFTPDELTWTQDWYLRTETVRAGNDQIVNHQIRQPIAQTWGTGTLSSSDGQRFPMVASSPRARAMRRYFTGSGATIYTWTSDRHAQYGTRIIPTTVREATYVLDAIFDNETDLDIEEHTTDTAGYTDLVFGLFDLAGLTLLTPHPRPRRPAPLATPQHKQRRTRRRPAPTPDQPGSVHRPLGRHAASRRHHPPRPPTGIATRLPASGLRHDRTSSPEPSKSTGGSSRRSRSSATSTTSNTGVASTPNSTRANHSTPSADNCSSPTKARSGAAAPMTRTSKANASPCSPTPSSAGTPSTPRQPSNTSPTQVPRCETSTSPGSHQRVMTTSTSTAATTSSTRRDPHTANYYAPFAPEIVVFRPFDTETPMSSVRSSPLVVSHSRTTWSLPAEARVVPSGLNATARTQPVWPVSSVRSSPLVVSHSRTIWSLPAEARVVPSGLTANYTHPAGVASEFSAEFAARGVPQPDSVVAGRGEGGAIRTERHPSYGTRVIDE